MKTGRRMGMAGVLAVALGWILAMSGSVSAQNKKSPIKIEMPTVVGFKAPITGEGGRMVALVSGSKATPSLVSGQVEVTDFRMETYRYAAGSNTPMTEIIVESPSGTFGPQGSGSSKKLTLRSAEDRFAITGTGWSWSQTSGQLVVSNAVETTLRRGSSESNRPPVTVRSGRFEYNLRTGDARFSKDCVAEDSGRARVSAGELSSRLTPRQAQPEGILATNGVVIELLRPGRPGRASGEGAVYSAASGTEGERIEVLGKPTWQFGPGEGSADHLVLLPARETYAARGHARLSLTPPPRTGTNAVGAVDKARRAVPILIESETIEAGPEKVEFEGPLIARQGDRLELKARHLVASLGPDPVSKQSTVVSAVATGDAKARVLDESEPLEFGGATMSYVMGESPRIEVDGQPVWKAASHSGKAKKFILDPEKSAFHALGGVVVGWHPGSKATNMAPVNLRAAELTVDGTAARFTGGVDAASDLWRLNARELDLVLSTNRALRGFDARQRVAMQYEMAPLRTATNSYSRKVLRSFTEAAQSGARLWHIRSASLHVDLDAASEPANLEATGGVDIRHPALSAKGGRLKFAKTDGLMRLLDNPELRSLDGVEIVGEPGTALTVDPRTGAFGVEGAVVRMVLPAGALSDKGSTNAPALPIGNGH